MPLEDRPTEDQFYCPTCQTWVATPNHVRRLEDARGYRYSEACPTLAVEVHSCGIPVTGIPSGTPTEVRDKMIAMHVSETQAADRADLERTGFITGSSYPADWRGHTLYDFSDCTHGETMIVDIVGDWDLEVCVRCGTQVHKQCRHTTNTWNGDGLTCDNCGVDGT